MRVWAVALACLWAGTLSAAAEKGDCSGYGDLAANPDLAIGRITAATPRVNFIKNASDTKGCPSAADSCKARGFLVPGDTVIVGAAADGFVCVDYISPKGDDRAAWLPAAAIERQPATPVTSDGWVGAWVRDAEANVTIKKAGTALQIDGDATYGALDPGRVKRGGVNVGNISGRVTPTGPALAFAVGSDETLPVDKGDEYDCKVWMRRLGPFLLVDDNNNCGGMNVSFRGAYRRR